MNTKHSNYIEHSTLQGILGDIGDGVILTDTHENIVYLNKAAEALLECKFSNDVQLKFSDVCRLINIDTKEEYYSPIRRTLREKKPVGLGKNVGIVRSEGAVYLSATCSPMRNNDGNITGCSVILRDVTHMRQLEKKVEADQYYMRSVFEAAKIGMCSVNVRGELVDINDTALETMQAEYREAIAAQIGDAFKCINSVKFGCGRGDMCRYCVIRNNLEAAIMDDNYTNDFVVAMESINSDEPQWLQIFLSQVWRENEKQIVLAIIDISKRKKKEQELKKAKQEAEAASNTKTQFLANMSHEIRTPINGMCGMINLTLKTDLTDDQRENLNCAKQCSEDLLRIINDILDYAKLENGKMQIERIDLDLYELLDRVCSLHGQVAEGKGLFLKIPDILGLPHYIKGDPLRIRQILHNLLTNALKFTTSGGVTVECHVNETGVRRILEFTVTDTGIGMSEEDQKKLFKPFSQVDGSTTRRFGGTGLGLMIVKELVTAMGGEIAVKSKLGKGSSFIFWIPLAEAEKADVEMKDKSVYINPYKPKNNANTAKTDEGDSVQEQPEVPNVPSILDNEPDDDILDLLQYCNDKLNDE
ncbi:MAG: ATP-binding protein [Selenomonadales bacterium]|nr:ATP-binding protein [Selenomonadales bacterium]